MERVLDKLNWRYATKVFDSSKKIPGKDMEVLLEAARLSASSYGLQPYHMYVIQDPSIREQLRRFSWGQPQITDASDLLVFANKTDFDAALIDNYITTLQETRNVPLKNLKAYSDFMKSKLLHLSLEEKSAWTSKQVYLALGNIMTIAAEMKIDTCAIEGFEPKKYNEVLGLDNQKLSATVALAIGYRSKTDETQYEPKVRFNKEQLITHL